MKASRDSHISYDILIKKEKGKQWRSFDREMRETSVDKRLVEAVGLHFNRELMNKIKPWKSYESAVSVASSLSVN